MNSADLELIRNFCRQNADVSLAEHCQRFFKTAPGEYGHGDIFWGIRTPVLRSGARLFRNVPYDVTEELLRSKFHEERSLALMIWVHQFERGTVELQQSIFDAYLSHTRWINNWDLVDLSAYKIVGAFLHNREKTILYALARSKSLWERRISIVSTYYFIRQRQFDDTFGIADILLHDSEDLIHKAVGWMLREVGKRDLKAEIDFLTTRYKTMPRTMLRYAIEKFDEPLRQKYLKGLI